MMKSSATALAALVLSIGCSSSSAAPAPVKDGGPTGGDTGVGTTACPRNGVILADIRDVERSGEGLVSTTFGDAASGRKPDWTRAAVVLTLLKTEWNRAKAACTDFPAGPAAQIDKAIVDLTDGIGSKDQGKAAQAANQVGLGVVDIFDYFHPDAPKEIVRMDAVYRQVGIDAHFGNLDASKTNFDLLKSDYNNAKGAISAKTPTCHRVAGTATVEGDIEASFANLDKAYPAKDTKVIEQESDNGALEIDTLELLFDCPPDGPAAGQGLGAVCKATADCVGDSLVCDPASGKCAPDPKTAKIGTKCTGTIDCGTDPRSACNTEAGDQYPGGYCFMEPCNDINVCPPGATCVALGGELPGCFQSCKTDADCRTAEGYVCQLFNTTPPAGFGPSSSACAFKCTRDTDCKTGTCDVASGKCKP